MKREGPQLDTGTLSHETLSSWVEKNYPSPGNDQIDLDLRDLINRSVNRVDETIVSQLEPILKTVALRGGIQRAFNLIQILETDLSFRKPQLAIYDHSFHLIGGGQKYGLTLANALKDQFDITLVGNRPFSHEQISQWYHLDLSGCPIKIIPLPFFEQKANTHIDPATITRRMVNPFHKISLESGNYDMFINNSMLEMVYPMAPLSILICHFPERRPKSYFYVDRYKYLVHNSSYTAEWMLNRWRLKPHRHIFPPVDMPLKKSINEREKLILSVARFETGGSKKQLEMVRTFSRMQELYPDECKDWRLLLVGGSPEENDYLDKINRYLKDHPNPWIQIETNIKKEKLKFHYSRASLFWHLCGLNQRDPALVEHFGMTIAEAMQNRLVPIVFDGGGQREIVDNTVNGFRIKSTGELMQRTIQMIGNSDLRLKIAAAAEKKGTEFSRDMFEKRVRIFLSEIWPVRIDGS